VSKNEALSGEVQTHFGSFHLARLIKKVLGALTRFLRPKTKQFAVKFRRIGSSLPARFTEKVLGACLRFMRPKAKLFTVKFRHNLEVLHLQGLQKKFWAHFYDLCVQKRSCLL